MPMNIVIQEQRKLLGLTQEQVADYLGVSLDTLVGYEGDPDKDLMKLKELASWLTEDQLVALIAVAEQLKGK